MAGLFGMFTNYSKPGPGIEKNGLQKHRFFLFFEIFFRKFWKMIQLNLLYFACCIPIVTIGAATAGYTYVLRNYSREENVFLVSDFFDNFKKNWKMSSVVFFISLLVWAVLGYAFMFYNANQNVFDPVLRIIAISVVLCLSFIFLCMQYYMYLLLVTFKVTFKQMVKNSFIFAIVGLWRNLLATIILALLIIAEIVLVIITYPVSILFVALIFLSLNGFVVMFIVYPLVKKHMIDPITDKENPEESLQEDTVFTDNTL